MIKGSCKANESRSKRLKTLYQQGRKLIYETFKRVETSQKKERKKKLKSDSELGVFTRQTLLKYMNLLS